MKKTYHIGLTQPRLDVAQFQARNSIDTLSCELLEYYGPRETTKKGLHNRLKADYSNILQSIQNKFPNIKRVLLTID